MKGRRLALVLLPTVLAISVPAFAQAPSAPRTATQTTPPPAAAQAPAPPPAPVLVYQDSERAENVREQLRQVLSRYPPTLRQVIQLDPTLLQRPDYMTAYPMLTTFLQQHPDVMRNPSYYFGVPNDRRDAEEHFGLPSRIVEAVSFLAGFLTVVTLVYSLLRQALEYRRWRKQIQVQTEVHLKLIDRLTNNQELLAYVQTSAGRQFLEAPAPLVAHPAGWSIAPGSRILWSVQIGVIVIAIGIGLWVARASIVDAELSSAFQVMGSLATTVGIGFVASALLSWALSIRMGLMSTPAARAE
jgi:hypothetical protein